MAKHFFFSLSLCLVLLFNVSFASEQVKQENECPQLQQQHQCRLDRIEALEPDTRIQSEAGTIESWNPSRDQFQCAGVAIVRRVIQPNGLLLPAYSNAHQLAFIVQGRGITGEMFPGCPETFQEYQGAGGSSRVEDQHQKVRHFRPGDIIALPAGVAHWCYNDGNEPVVAIYLLDTANSDNQLDMNPRHFYLAGNPEDEFRQLYEGRREPGSGRHEGFSSRRRPEGRGTCNNLFCGLDSRLISEAFNIDESLARKLQSENDYRGSIINVEGKLQVVRPARTQSEREQQVGGSGAGGPYLGGGGCNGLEETFCSMRLKENIADPSRADVYIPEVGRVSTINSHNLPILRFLQLSASHVVLRNNAVRLPHWHLNAHSIIYALRGQGRVQITDEFGEIVFDGSVGAGQVLTVPQNFVVVKQAETERFEYITFKTSDNAMTNDLVGRTSAVRALPLEVIANAFRVSREDARRIKFGREETTLGTSRSRPAGRTAVA
ncbi:hypothetical protein JCGZ_17688 [Jatropha curcas]|uniref:Cupin type-1 domain-containing protein n=1 Tax=Jatropha curcas TaxID=180498 RepID=A0A067K2P3_JATCU|nr:hypothetical protein JCGZ_17688 [Jatropha curcas]